MDEKHVNALAGMAAAIEYARTMHGGMAGQLDPAGVQQGLDFIAADCMRAFPPLDILGALASITLRAAQKSVNLTGGTVPQFLDELEAELKQAGDFGESPA
jgi:hypothetical protein